MLIFFTATSKIAVNLEQYGFTGHYVLHDLPPLAVDCLAMLGIDGSRIITNVATPTYYSTVLFMTPVNAWNARMHRGIYTWFRERMIAAAASPKNRSPARIWMERITGVNNKGRELANPDDVHQLLDRYGFECVDMATFPIGQQIAIASNARGLAGIHGAAFAHTLFLPAGSAVIECYSPTFINTGILDLCFVNRLRYSMLVFQNAYAGYPYGNQVMVNCAHLELVLQMLDSSD